MTNIKNETTDTLPTARDAALKCHDCGLKYGGAGWADFVVPDDVWLRISPTGDLGGILCATCMFARMEKLGIDNVDGAFTSGPCANHDWQKPTAARDADDDDAREKLFADLEAEFHFDEDAQLKELMQAVWDAAESHLTRPRPSGDDEVIYEKCAEAILASDTLEEALRAMPVANSHFHYIYELVRQRNAAMSRSRDGWVDVAKDGLPEIADTYLVTTRDDEVKAAWFIRRKDVFVDLDGGNVYDVIAYMPLPEPFQKEGK